jgi:hypothetical protein
MPAYNAVAFAVEFVMGVGIALVVYALLRKNLRELLTNVITLPAGTTFYLRAFVLVLLFVALAKVVTPMEQKPEAHFMQYVWAVAANLSGVFENLCLRAPGLPGHSHDSGCGAET